MKLISNLSAERIDEVQPLNCPFLFFLKRGMFCTCMFDLDLDLFCFLTIVKKGVFYSSTKMFSLALYFSMHTYTTSINLS